MDNETPTTKRINIFAAGNVLDPHIRIEGKCRACQGTGKGEFRAHCVKCGSTYFPDRPDFGDFTDEQMAEAEDTPPCQHGWDNWVEQDHCIACEGTGKDSALVRVCDLITAPSPALEFIMTVDETV